MRASRLLSILLLLQTRDRVTAQELADALEVSVRTVYRDMESLSAAGVPLYGDAGHDGGYRLLDGFRTRLTGLTAAEADSLFLTGLPTAAADLGMGAFAAAVRLKLMASLPAEFRDRADRSAERFHLDAPAWYRVQDRTPYLTTIAEAVWSNRGVRLRYLRWAEPHEITRTVEPYGLVLKAGQWYVVGGTDGRLRTYRVSRIEDLHVLDETFERPDGFSLADYWQEYLRFFDERRTQNEATLRLSPTAFERLPYLWDSTTADAAQQSATPPDADSWIHVTIPIESTEQALPELLKLGADAEVLAPAELRQAMALTVDVLTSIYRRGAQGRSGTSDRSGPG